MKKLFVLSLLILLTGCVTYYQPETALEDGVYYAEDDPSYVFNSGDYSGVVYYPWSSLDYLYLGYSNYYGYGFTYGYPYGWVYSPWGYPYAYYDYYSPWSFPSHRYSHWRPYRGNCSQNPHHSGCRNKNDNNDGGHDRYARDDRKKHRSRDDEAEDYTQIGDEGAGRKNPALTRRYILTSPGGYAGNQGMVIRNRETTKIGQSRLEPSTPVRSKSTGAGPSASAISRPMPATSTPGISSGNSKRSSSRSSSSRHHRSTSSKSSRRKDRD